MNIMKVWKTGNIYEKNKSIKQFFLIFFVFCLTFFIIFKQAPHETKLQEFVTSTFFRLKYPVKNYFYYYHYNGLDLKKLIENDCHVNLAKDSDKKIALALMDFVFRTTLRGPPSKNITTPLQKYLFARTTPPLQQTCEGYAKELKFLLERVGIQSRIYHLGAPSVLTGPPLDAHTLIEARINNKWVTLDPTFNCYWTCNDSTQMLSVQEMYRCHKLGNTLKAHEGISKIPGYALSEYYLDFKNLFYVYKYIRHEGWQFFDLKSK